MGDSNRCRSVRNSYDVLPFLTEAHAKRKTNLCRHRLSLLKALGYQAPFIFVEVITGKKPSKLPYSAFRQVLYRVRSAWVLPCNRGPFATKFRPCAVPSVEFIQFGVVARVAKKLLDKITDFVYWRRLTRAQKMVEHMLCVIPEVADLPNQTPLLFCCSTDAFHLKDEVKLYFTYVAHVIVLFCGNWLKFPQPYQTKSPPDHRSGGLFVCGGGKVKQK